MRPLFAAVLLPLLLPLPALAPTEIFSDVTAQAGITWQQFNGESPERYLLETTTGGVAFLDFNNDGLLDIFFVNGGETPNGKSEKPVRHALYRNLGDGRFEDVAAKAGVAQTSFYGMGIAAADFDNDGFSDIYLTGYPSGALFHNNGDSTFEDITSRAGVDNAGEWGASAAWFDYDRDGWLDLFVCNYVRFSYDDKKECEFGGQRTYCAQTEYEGRSSRLYHNSGDGTFSDVSRASGISQHVGRALGVVAIDANDDGWDDLFVARDASPNLLLINQQDGAFADRGLEAEVAYNSDGVARAGMGVDVGDLDGDGRPDFVVTNFDHEYHAMYLNPGRFPYREVTVQSRLARHTKPYVGWGVRLIDFDNSGTLDLLITNGHLHEQIEISSTIVKYKEPPLLLSNNGKAFFDNVSHLAGPSFETGYVGRGLATGDFNNDGATDAAFVSLNSRPVLLRNDAAHQKPWVGVKLRGKRSNRDAIGAKLTLHTAAGKRVRWITGGGSFQASHDRRVIFGLGEDTADAELEIRWPSGTIQRVARLAPNRYHKVIETEP